MKDKLRELAERWKSYDGYVTGKRDALSVCADELRHVLDAEGAYAAILSQHAEWPSDADVARAMEAGSAASDKYVVTERMMRAALQSVRPPAKPDAGAVSDECQNAYFETAERGEAVAKIVDSSISEDGYLIPKYAKLVNKAAKKLRAGTKLYTAPPPAAGVPDELAWRNPAPHAAAAIGMTTTHHIAYGPSSTSATPSPAIDVAAVGEVIARLRSKGQWVDLKEEADKLARAIGDAK